MNLPELKKNTAFSYKTSAKFDVKLREIITYCSVLTSIFFFNFLIRYPFRIFFFQAQSGALESDWKFAAMVLDRVCLIAFSLFTVLLSAAVLIAAPHVLVG